MCLHKVLLESVFNKGTNLMVPVHNPALNKQDSRKAVNVLVLFVSKHFIQSPDRLNQILCQLWESLRLSTQQMIKQTLSRILHSLSIAGKETSSTKLNQR